MQKTQQKLWRETYLKTLKKTFIMIILTLICVILIDNYNRAKDEQKLEKKKEDGKIDISEPDEKEDKPC